MKKTLKQTINQLFGISEQSLESRVGLTRIQEKALQGKMQSFHKYISYADYKNAYSIINEATEMYESYYNLGFKSEHYEKILSTARVIVDKNYKGVE